MKDLTSLLLAHGAAYPQMEPRDMAKLLYQGEFGGGHLIADEGESLARLTAEWESVKEIKTPAPPLFEEIGGGFCRVHLGALAASGISPKTVNRLFVLGANRAVGTVQGLIEKLALLQGLCEKGLLPFCAEELKGFLEDYEKKGYPPVSHSETYRRLYRPAYRVIRSEFRPFWPLFCSVDRLMQKKEPVAVAVDGPSGAGKSSLGSLLGEIYGCNVIPMDHFFLPPSLRTEERLGEAGGNIDYARFAKEVIEKLKQRQPFTYSVYDCRTKSFYQSSKVPVSPLTVVEGVYSLHPAFFDFYDLKVFLAVEAETQKSRILARNGPILYRRFAEEWIPMENRYFAVFDIKNRCDLVLFSPSLALSDEGAVTEGD